MITKGAGSAHRPWMTLSTTSSSWAPPMYTPPLQARPAQTLTVRGFRGLKDQPRLGLAGRGGLHDSCNRAPALSGWIERETRKRPYEVDRQRR
jgi:hypothetical protein